MNAMLTSMRKGTYMICTPVPFQQVFGRELEAGAMWPVDEGLHIS